MRARILLLFVSLLLFNCNNDPTLCECDQLHKKIKNSEDKPTEPDDPRIELLKKCEQLHSGLSDEEKKTAKTKIQECN